MTGSGIFLFLWMVDNLRANLSMYSKIHITWVVTLFLRDYLRGSLFCILATIETKKKLAHFDSNSQSN